ncbi:hypothetical protein [Synechococcus sp. W4D4]|uniref:hypothetical protein n=1 Tax=Synechococcus sp. W4D4 TaxID=3392294 RepID=UPI0039E98A8B
MIRFGDDEPETTAVTPVFTGLSLITGDGGLFGGNDTALAASDTDDGIADVAAAFIAAVTPVYGADGFGTVTINTAESDADGDGVNDQGIRFVSDDLTAGGAGFDTGLVLSSDGTTKVYAFLSANGLTLTGASSADIGATPLSTAFTITIDGTTGAMTQTQSLSLEHGTATDGTDLSSYSGVYSGDRVDLADGGLDLKIQASVRTTDADGDYVNQLVTSADVASSFVFGDDGPGDGVVGSVNLGSLSLITGDGGLFGGNDTALAASDTDDGIADVAAAFIAAVTPVYGADGFGTVTINTAESDADGDGVNDQGIRFVSDDLTAGGAGFDTGLVLSSDGTTKVYAFLSANGLTLTGASSADIGATPLSTAFTITIDGTTGAMTQTQSLSLEHGTATDGTDLSSYSGVYSGDRVDLADGGLDLKIQASVRTTDADGDYVNQLVTSADVASSFVFGDDGPGDGVVGSVNLGSLSLITGDGGLFGGNDTALAASDTDDGIADVAAAFIAAVTPVYGADGFGTVTINTAESDADGDGVNDQGIRFVSDDLTAGGAGFDTGLVLSSDGTTKVYAFLSANGLTLTGASSADIGATPLSTAFTITIDGTTGAMTQTQSLSLEHGTATDGTDLSSYSGVYSGDRVDLADGGLDLKIQASVRTTDADGDYVNQLVTSADVASSFVFGDDGPGDGVVGSVNLGSLSLITGDGGLFGGNDTALAASDTDDGIADVAAAFIAAVTPVYGADGFGTVTINTAESDADGDGVNDQGIRFVSDDLTAGGAGFDTGLVLSSDGTTKVYAFLSANGLTLTGASSADIGATPLSTAFTITIDGTTGAMTQTQSLSLEHGTATDGTDLSSYSGVYSGDRVDLADGGLDLKIQASVRTTDADGDYVNQLVTSADVASSFVFGDDGPGDGVVGSVNLGSLSLITGDGGLFGGNDTALAASDTDDGIADVAAAFIAAVTPVYGADGFGTVTINTAESDADGDGVNDQGIRFVSDDLTAGGAGFDTGLVLSSDGTTKVYAFLSANGLTLTGASSADIGATPLSTAFTITIDGTTGAMTQTQSLSLEHGTATDGTDLSSYSGVYSGDRVDLADGGLDLKIQASVRTTDADGDYVNQLVTSADVASSFVFGDDGPGDGVVGSVNLGSLSLITGDGGLFGGNDTALAASDTDDGIADVAAAFIAAVTPVYGADGFGTVTINTAESDADGDGVNDQGIRFVSDDLTAGGAGFDTGLVLSSDGTTKVYAFLSANGLTLTGASSADIGATPLSTAFTITIDGTTGAMTQTQSLSLEHGTATDGTDLSSYSGVYSGDRVDLADGGLDLKIQASVRTTDADGDYVNQLVTSADVASSFVFGDDGPGDGVVGSVNLGSLSLITGDGGLFGGNDTALAASDTDDGIADVAAAFIAAVTPVYGADGFGTVTINTAESDADGDGVNDQGIRFVSDDLTAGGAGFDTGLVLSSDGTTKVYAFLSANGLTLTGASSADIGATPLSTAFTITIDGTTGAMTQTQSLSLEHGTATDGTDLSSYSGVYSGDRVDLADGGLDLKIQASVRTTDADGDYVNQLVTSADVASSFVFGDDGPGDGVVGSVNLGSLSLITGDGGLFGGNDTALAASDTDDGIADVAAAFIAAVTPVYGADGFGTVTINTAESDADGDGVNDQGIRFVSDDLTAGGAGFDTGLVLSSDGTTKVYAFLSANGLTLTGASSADIGATPLSTAFTITIDGTTGAMTQTQSLSLEHGTATDGTDLSSYSGVYSGDRVDLADGGLDLKIQASVRTTDADGDYVNQLVTSADVASSFVFGDDGPGDGVVGSVNLGSLSLITGDGGLFGGNDTALAASDTDDGIADVAAAFIAAVTPVYGADGFGTVTINTAESDADGDGVNDQGIRFVSDDLTAGGAGFDTGLVLSSDGTTKVYAFLSANGLTLTGASSADIGATPLSTAFTITIDGTTGAMTQTQSLSLEHGTATDGTDLSSYSGVYSGDRVDLADGGLDLKIQASVRTTDADGDYVNQLVTSADVASSFVFGDDGPGDGVVGSVNLGSLSLITGDGGLFGGNDTALAASDTDDGIADVAAAFIAAVTPVYGADGFGTVTINTAESDADGDGVNDQGIRFVSDDLTAGGAGFDTGLVLSSDGTTKVYAFLSANGLTLTGASSADIGATPLSTAFTITIDGTTGAMTQTQSLSLEHGTATDGTDLSSYSGVYSGDRVDLADGGLDLKIQASVRTTDADGDYVNQLVTSADVASSFVFGDDGPGDGVVGSVNLGSLSLITGDGGLFGGNDTALAASDTDDGIADVAAAFIAAVTPVYGADGFGTVTINTAESDADGDGVNDQGIRFVSDDLTAGGAGFDTGLVLSSDGTTKVYAFLSANGLTLTGASSADIGATPLSTAFTITIDGTTGAMTQTQSLSLEHGTATDGTDLSSYSGVYSGDRVDLADGGLDLKIQASVRTTDADGDYVNQLVTSADVASSFVFGDDGPGDGVVGSVNLGSLSLITGDGGLFGGNDTALAASDTDDGIADVAAAFIAAVTPVYGADGFGTVTINTAESDADGDGVNDQGIRFVSDDLTAGGAGFDTGLVLSSDGTTKVYAFLSANGLTLTGASSADIGATPLSTAFTITIDGTTGAMTQTQSLSLEHGTATDGTDLSSYSGVYSGDRVDLADGGLDLKIQASVRTTDADGDYVNQLVTSADVASSFVFGDDGPGDGVVGSVNLGSLSLITGDGGLFGGNDTALAASDTDDGIADVAAAFIAAVTPVYGADGFGTVTINTAESDADGDGVNDQGIRFVSDDLTAGGAGFDTGLVLSSDGTTKVYAFLSANGLTLTGASSADIGATPLSTAFTITIDGTTGAMTQTQSLSLEHGTATDGTDLSSYSGVYSGDRVDLADGGLDLKIQASVRTTDADGDYVNQLVTSADVASSFVFGDDGPGDGVVGSVNLGSLSLITGDGGLFGGNDTALAASDTDDGIADVAAAFIAAVTPVYGADGFGTVTINTAESDADGDGVNDQGIRFVSDDLTAGGAGFDTGLVLSSDGTTKVYAFLSANGLTLTGASSADIGATPLSTAFTITIDGTTGAMTQTQSLSLEHGTATDGTDLSSYSGVYSGDRVDLADGGLDLKIQASVRTTDADGDYVNQLVTSADVASSFVFGDDGPGDGVVGSVNLGSLSLITGDGGLFGGNDTALAASDTDDGIADVAAAFIAAVTPVYGADGFGTVTINTAESDADGDGVNDQGIRFVSDDLTAGGAGFDTGLVLSSDGTTKVYAFLSANGLTLTGASSADIGATPLSTAFTITIDGTTGAMTQTQSLSLEHGTATDGTDLSSYSGVYSGDRVDLADGGLDLKIQASVRTTDADGDYVNQLVTSADVASSFVFGDDGPGDGVVGSVNLGSLSLITGDGGLFGGNDTALAASDTDDGIADVAAAFIAAVTPVYGADGFGTVTINTAESDADGDGVNDQGIRFVSDDLTAGGAGFDTGLVLSSDGTTKVYAFLSANGLTLTGASSADIGATPLSTAFTITIDGTTGAMTQTQSLSLEHGTATDGTDLSSYSGVYSGDRVDLADGGLDLKIQASVRTTDADGDYVNQLVTSADVASSFVFGDDGPGDGVVGSVNLGSLSLITGDGGLFGGNDTALAASDTDDGIADVAAAFIAAVTPVYGADGFGTVTINTAESDADGDGVNDQGIRFVSDDLTAGGAGFDTGLVLSSDGTTKVYAFLSANGLTLTGASSADIGATPLSTAFTITIDGTTGAMTQTQSLSLEHGTATDGTDLSSYSGVYSGDRVDLADGGLDLKIQASVRTTDADGDYVNQLVTSADVASSFVFGDDGPGDGVVGSVNLGSLSLITGDGGLFGGNDTALAASDTDDGIADVAAAFIAAVTPVYGADGFGTVTINTAESDADGDGVNDQGIRFVSDDLTAGGAGFDTGLVLSSDGTTKVYAFLSANGLTLTGASSADIGATPLSTAFTITIDGTTGAMTQTQSLSLEHGTATDGTDLSSYSGVYSGDRVDLADGGLDLKIQASVRTTDADGDYVNQLVTSADVASSFVFGDDGPGDGVVGSVNLGSLSLITGDGGLFGGNDTALAASDTDDGIADVAAAFIAAVTPVYGADGFGTVTINTAESDADGDGVNDQGIRFVSDDLTAGGAGFDTGLVLSSDGTTKVYAFLSANGLTLTGASSADIGATPLSTAFTITIDGTTGAMTQTQSLSLEHGTATDGTDLSSYSGVYSGDRVDLADGGLDLKIQASVRTTDADGDYVNQLVTSADVASSFVFGDDGPGDGVVGSVNLGSLSLITGDGGLFGGNDTALAASDTDDGIADVAAAFIAAVTPVYGADGFGTVTINTAESDADGDGVNDQGIRFVSDDLTAGGAGFDTGLVLSSDGTTKVYAFLSANGLTLTGASSADIGATPLSTAFTITIDGTTGAMTQTQSLSLEHGTATDGTDLSSYSGVYSGDRVDLADGGLDLKIQASVRTTDADGDYVNQLVTSADVASSFVFGDDGPGDGVVGSVNLGSLSLITGDGGLFGGNDTALAASDTDDGIADVAAAFIAAVTPVYGADGFGTVTINTAESDADGDGVNDQGIRFVSDDLTAGGAGFDTGLVLSSDGTTKVYAFLSANGLTLTGASSADIGATPLSTAFTITIDGTTGAMTQTQSLSLEHGTATDGTDLSSYSGVYSGDRVDLADGGLDLKIQASVRTTDADGDYVNQLVTSADVASSFVFGDDGPGDGVVGSVNLGSLSLITGDGGLFGGNDTALAASDTDDGIADVAAAFIAAVTPVYGADGFGTVTINTAESDADGDGVNDQGIRFVSDDLTAGGAGFDTGLVLSSDGTTKVYAFLSANGLTLTGASSADIGATPLSTAFTITIDGTTGAMTQTQSLSLEHGTATDGTDLSSYSGVYSGDRVDLADGGLDLKIQASVRTTDADGDYVNQLVTSADVASSFVFGDDGPGDGVVGSVNLGSLSLITGDGGLFGGNDTALAASDTDDGIADVAAAFIAAVTPVYGADGFGTVTINTAESDADGDGVNDQGIRFVSDDLTAGGAGFDTGLVLSSDGTTKVYAFLSANGLTLTGASSADIGATPLSTAFTITIDGTTGAMTQTQSLSLEHGTATDGTDLSSYSGVYSGDRVDLADGGLDLKIQASVRTTDADGDYVNQLVTSADVASSFVFGDDGPGDGVVGSVNLGSLSLITGDGGLFGGNDTALAASDTDDGIADVAAAFIAAVTPVYGADGFGTVTINTAESDADGDGVNDQGIRFVSDDLTAGGAGFDTGLVLSSDGTTKVYAFLSANGLTLTGASSADIGATPLSTAFTITIDGTTGAMTQTQSLSLEHGTATDGTDLSSYSGVYSGDRVDLADGGLDLKIQASVRTTDADGDYVNQLVTSADVASSFVFGDDGPGDGVVGSVNLGSLSLITGDGGLFGGNDTALAASDTDDGIADVAAAFIAAVTPVYGADGFGTVTINTAESDADGDGVNDQGIRFVSDDLTAGGAGFDTGLVLSSDGTTKVYAFLSANGLTLTGASSADIGATPLSTAFTITIDGTTGAMTQTQSLSLEHGTATDGTDLSSYSGVYSGDRVDLADGGLDLKIQASVRTTDADGDYVNQLVTSADVASSFVFGDDGPIDTVTIQGLSVLNLAAEEGTSSLVASATDLTEAYGADSNGNVRFDASLDGFVSGLTYQYAPVTYALNPSGTILIASAGSQVVFQVELDSSSNGSEVVMTKPVDATTQVSFTDEYYDYTGGNGAWSGWGDGSALVDDDSSNVLFTPWLASSSGAGSTTTFTYSPLGTINTSGILGGISSGQSVYLNEAYRVDFVTDLYGSKAKGNQDFSDQDDRSYNFDSHYLTQGASARLTQTNGSSVLVSAWDDDDGAVNSVGGLKGAGQLSESTVTKDEITGIVIGYQSGIAANGDPIITNGSYVTSSTTSYQFVDADGVSRAYQVEFGYGSDGKDVRVDGVVGDTGNSQTGTIIFAYTANGYNALTYTNIGGESFKIGDFKTAVPSTESVSTDLPVVIVDGDGDFVSASLALEFASPTLPPISIDLNSDAYISYLSADSGSVEIFIAALGSLSTAWVAPEDGLLVYDYNADGLIAEAKEFVFTMWGDDPDVLTDMQALAAYFDSNGDGLLDASDHAWEYFGVWQDLNIDGIQQEGEFYGLDHWDIESIALEYHADSAPYTAADGDVQVYGQMTVTYDDGSTGLAEDVAFAVASVDHPDASLEPIVVDSSAASSVEDLVSSYLESMHTIGDLDGNGDLSQAELASGLDLAVSDYLDANALSADAYGVIEQEVFNVLAEQINDLESDSPVDIQIDDQGNADGADLIAALDQTFDDLMLPDSPEPLDLVSVGSEYG